MKTLLRFTGDVVKRQWMMWIVTSIGTIVYVLSKGDPAALYFLLLFCVANLYQYEVDR